MIKLVVCQPYDARMTKTACVARFHKAKEIRDDPPAGNAAIRNVQLETSVGKCRGCRVGAKRAKEVDHGKS